MIPKTSKALDYIIDNLEGSLSDLEKEVNKETIFALVEEGFLDVDEKNKKYKTTKEFIDYYEYYVTSCAYLK